MVESHNQRPSQWPQLFTIACELIDQVAERTGGYDFQWSFGGGTAMMIQIGHRESHDIDIFFDDPQLLGFLDPAKSDLTFSVQPNDYVGDGARFQKFAFADLGEIDFIAAGALTASPIVLGEVNGRPVILETIPEIIAKKVYHRGGEAKPRDIFDMAAAARDHRAKVVEGLQDYPDKVVQTKARLEKLNPEFVTRAIGQLMILPAYAAMADESLNIARALLEDVS